MKLIIFFSWIPRRLLKNQMKCIGSFLGLGLHMSLFSRTIFLGFVFIFSINIINYPLPINCHLSLTNHNHQRRQQIGNMDSGKAPKPPSNCELEEKHGDLGNRSKKAMSVEYYCNNYFPVEILWEILLRPPSKYLKEN